MNNYNIIGLDESCSSPLKPDKEFKLISSNEQDLQIDKEIPNFDQTNDNDENFTNKVIKVQLLSQNKNHLNSTTTPLGRVIQLDSSPDSSVIIGTGSDIFSVYKILLKIIIKYR